MKVFALFGLFLVTTSATVFGADKGFENDWLKIGEGDKGKLYVLEKSVQTMGDGYSLRYRLEFPVPQVNNKGGKEYLSMVVDATIFCAARTILRTELSAYAEHDAKGEVVGGYKSSVLTEKAVPIAPGASDEDIWRYVCKRKGPLPGAK